MKTDAAGVAPSRAERDQFTLLLRNFIRRLFESDLVPESINLRHSAIWLAAILAMPPSLMTLGLTWKYSLIAQVFPERYDVATWPDKLFFLGYSMAAVGFLTVLVWDSLFPDRRDAVVLGAIPIRGGTVLAAKLTALVVFVVGFATAINIPTAAMFGFSVGGYQTWGVFFRYFPAHLLASVAAGTFVFLCLIAAQTTLVVLLPRRVLRAISVVAQLVFVVFLIEWFFYSPGLLTRLAAVNEPLLTGEPIAGVTNLTGFFAGAVSGGLGAWLPPMWFLGLYEVVLGKDPGAFQPLATTAILAMAAALGVAALAYTASYRRIVRHTLETPHEAAPRNGLVTPLVRRATFATILRHPIERAVVAFAAQSLARSRRHRLLIAIYLGVGLALVIGNFLGPFVDDRAVDLSFAAPTAAMLSIPLVLSFFTLVALRVMFTVPTELDANWIFQMTESDDKRAYLNGARKAMLLLGLPAIVLATLPMYWVLWGPGLALGHTIVWLLLAALLTELLLVRFHKVPFTCSYIPGKANVKLLWPAYGFAMTTYAYTTARAELWLLADPLRWAVACATAALVLVAAMTYRTHTSKTTDELTYDESTDPTVQVLHLMRPV